MARQFPTIEVSIGVSVAASARQAYGCAMPALPMAAVAGARRLCCAWVLLAAAAAQGAAAIAGAAAPAFSEAELQRIRTLGPWPPPWRADPANPVSGRPLAIELGRQLFRDPRMSPVGYIACVTCHQPDRAFTDNKARAHGLADLPHNTPALANLSLQRRFGWGGEHDRLWKASLRPIVDAREFNGSAASVVQLFVREPALTRCYRSVFGESPLADPPRTLRHVAQALAAFVETLRTGRTPFDDFGDALRRGDARAIAAYPPPARRGLRLFVGGAGCVNCHAGANFSDGELHDALSPSATSATSARYRTPSLRNVAVTGPYLHDGRAAALAEAIGHQPQSAAWLTAQNVADLEAFLVTLTDAQGERRPWAAGETSRCMQPAARSVRTSAAPAPPARP